MIRIKIGMAKTKSGANVILVKDGKILLLLRRLGWKTGYWGPPGGHIDPGETPKQAAVRETFEEAGLRIKESDLELVAQRTKHDFGMIYYYITDKYISLIMILLRNGLKKISLSVKILNHLILFIKHSLHGVKMKEILKMI